MSASVRGGDPGEGTAMNVQVRLLAAIVMASVRRDRMPARVAARTDAAPAASRRARQVLHHLPQPASEDWRPRARRVGPGAGRANTPRSGKRSCARFGRGRCLRLDVRGRTKRSPRASRRGSRRSSTGLPLEHPNPGRPTLHRLNRAEYRNAIRDLLALEIDPASLLPPDNAAYGFDNNADALSLSPALTERYLGAAAKISQMALGQVRGSPSPETVFVPTDRNQGSRFSEDLPWGSRGGLAIRYYFPVDGEYLFQLRLNESGAGGGIMGLTAEPHQLDVSLDRARVWTSTRRRAGIREGARAGADRKRSWRPCSSACR